MADIPNIPKEVIEKLPTADQWKKNGWSEIFVCETKQHGWPSSAYLK